MAKKRRRTHSAAAKLGWARRRRKGAKRRRTRSAAAKLGWARRRRKGAKRRRKLRTSKLGSTLAKRIRGRGQKTRRSKAGGGRVTTVRVKKSSAAIAEALAGIPTAGLPKGAKVTIRAKEKGGGWVSLSGKTDVASALGAAAIAAEDVYDDMDFSAIEFYVSDYEEVYE